MIDRYTVLGISFALSTALFAQGDTCTNALPVLAGFHHADGPTTGDGGAYGCGGSGQNGDWYAYTASFTGTINITSCNDLNNQTDDDTYVKVFTGSCGSLTCVGFNDDMGANSCPGYFFATYLDVPVVAGQTYYIVWTSMFDSDDFHWTLSECFGTVTGSVYRDVNTNGVRDVGEDAVYTVLEQDPGDVLHYAGSDTYSFCSDSGAFTLSLPNPPLYHTVVPPTRTYTVTTLGQLVNDLDFGLQPEPGHYDGRADIWGWAPWIGNNTTYHINYRNVGTEDLDGDVVLTLDTLTSFVSSTPAPTSVNGQTITWAVAALPPGAQEHITVTYHTDSTALTTDLVVAMVVFDVDQLEETPSDNTDDLSAHPTTSFDPNDKQVDAAMITPDQIAEGKALAYTVRFQNTGEMPAVNIVLRDQIDMDLDLSTFQMIGSTHEHQVSFNGNEVVWTFSNIMLPDSASDPAGSQGAVHFTIRPKAALLPGTLIENSAAIYFDYNEPVITNTVVTEVATLAAVEAQNTAAALRVFPSPGAGPVQLLWNAAATTNATIEVMDAAGRIVHSARAAELAPGRTIAFDLSGLSNGDYRIRIRNERMNVSAPVIILR